jgi:phosphoribosylaminoimidazolecarboxamide formyltransferase/IMP cyclohydrolase
MKFSCHRWSSIGILARSIPSDLKDLEDNGISPISIVVCNLYPFTETISKPDCSSAAAVEEIDIGGVTLLRAAAKNHERVTVLSDPQDYQGFLKTWTDADLSPEKLAGPIQRLPLRYGANPHQKPAQAFIEGRSLPFKGI